MTPSPTVAFCIPIYDDWESASVLLDRIDQVAGRKGLAVDVFLIDDGSSTAPGDLVTGPFETIGRVELLHLRRNLGHQRAIAVGLAYLQDREEHGRVVIMDGDGHDAPEDVPKLLEVLDGAPDGIVFAARARRSESLTFRFFYQSYKALHLLLTGMRVEVGNFSAVPRAALDRLVAVSELWNHYAAAVHKSRIPSTNVPIARAKRLAGESRMNFVNLAAHGLSAMSVHGEVIGVRLLVASGTLIALSSAALITFGVLAALPATQLPAWAALVAGVLVLLTGIALLLALVFVFVILQGRAGATFLPIRDYGYYVAGTKRAFERTG